MCIDFVLCNKRGRDAPLETLPRQRGPLLKGLHPPLFVTVTSIRGGFRSIRINDSVNSLPTVEAHIENNRLQTMPDNDPPIIKGDFSDKDRLLLLLRCKLLVRHVSNGVPLLEALRPRKHFAALGGLGLLDNQLLGSVAVLGGGVLVHVAINQLPERAV